VIILPGMKNPGPLFIITGLDPLEVNEAYQKETVAWKRTRLLVIRLAMSGAHHRGEVARIAGCSVSAVASWAKLCRQGGLEALLQRKSNGHDQCPLSLEQLEAVRAGLREGKWTRIKDMAAWARETFSIPLSYPAARGIMKKLGAKIKVPRRSHIKKARAGRGLQGKPRAETAGPGP
jgi:transposase